jgi:hypothetical protein
MSALVPPPVLDTRTYQDLVDEALARIPIHNPDWTNFNQSDPGVTLLELFAFLTENLLYRANQIPERNRRAFLDLLGIPLKPAGAARGIVTLSNDNGPPQAVTLSADLEVLAAQVPFRTAMGLDLLPVEAQVFYKRVLDDAPQPLVDRYRALYASFTGPAPDLTTLVLYETATLDPAAGVDLAATADGALWVALLTRRADGTGDAALAGARSMLAGRTLSLGVVPIQDDPNAQLSPLGRGAADATARLEYQLPRVGEDGSLGSGAARVPAYRTLDAVASANVLEDPGIVQLTLPDEAGLRLWSDIDPLEAGAGALPPPLEDTTLGDRVITWLRITAPNGGRARLLWTGINAVAVTQQARVVGEVLGDGSGAPDQTVQLANRPVVAGSLTLRVAGAIWTEVDDLYVAGPEVPVPDLRSPPGTTPSPPAPATVYTLDPTTGAVSFGDGLHGARPPKGAAIRADYAAGAGRAGNVGPGAITGGPALPPGAKVTNPVRTWGGADAETVADGSKQVRRHLQHRDRGVSAEDFESIVRRTPGIDVGRVDVIPAFNPELAPSAPGDAPGAVTLLLIPKSDPAHPGAPQPDQPFLDAVCAYLDPRRLVTTEVFLRGPAYKPIWLSVGFEPVAGVSIAVVREAIKAALLAFLAPLPDPAQGAAFGHAATGWPRMKPVVGLELLAVASRVSGVDLVQPVLVGTGGAEDGSAPIALRGLELPQVAGISVQAGDPLPLAQLQGSSPADVPPTVVPVPVIPDSC